MSLLLQSFLSQDLRYGVRTLLKTPAFTAVAILTLGLGIGANTAIFSFIDGILLKPLPYDDADRIVRVLEKPPGGARNGISTLNFLDWKHDNTVFETMAAQTGGSITLSGRNEPELLRTGRVSADYFKIFKLNAALGRTFLPDEDQAGKDHVVILSHVTWRDRFGSDPGILNRPILLDNEPYTVIGILPSGSAFDRATNQIWLPLTFQPSNMTRNFHWFGAFARLKPGVSLDQARKAMDVIGARIATEFPDSNKGWGVVVERYGDVIVGPEIRTALLVLISATGMVLLIGCANLANLALARGVAREREVAVRAALGASRWRLMRQFLTENVLLSVCGGVLGIGIGFATMKYLNTLVGTGNLPRESDVTMDAQVLLFALAISVVTGILFGLAPALQATSPELGNSMKDGGRGASTGTARRKLRDVLVVAEISLAFVLLVGSGLMIRSFFRLINVDMGFDSTNLLTMTLRTSDKQYPDTAGLNNYLNELQSVVHAVPGVRETAITCAVPLQGACYGMPMQVANRPAVDRANRKGGFFKIVSASYFHAVGIRALRGRVLTDRDRKGGLPAIVINSRLAARDFPNQDPVGQHILIQEIVPGKTELGPEIPWEVVGVIADEKVNGLNDESSAGVYVSNEQSPSYGMSLIVRAGLDPLALQKAITQAIHGVNKDQAISDIRTLEQIKSEDSLGDAIQAGLLVVFGTIAFLLAAIGIYGVMSYAVIQRTHEIGIRAALGASASSLRKLILYRGMVLTGIGLTIGIAGALALTRAMASLLYGVGVRDPLTMVSVGALLALAALIACYVPAHRATRVDPIVALRHE
jgi:putative ABC transport system permease protein